MMKYDELIGKLRGCEGYRCEDCELRREEFCNLVRMEKAADALEELTMKLHGDEAAIAGMKQQIERMVVNSGNKPKWIPVKERLPEEKCKCLVYKKHTRLSALVSFTNDLESIDNYDFQGQKRWGFFYYDSEYGYCESLGVTHWMPMPKPPKEEEK